MIDIIEKIKKEYTVVGVIDLDGWYDQPIYQQSLWLTKQVTAVHRAEYQPSERVVFTLTRGDVYDSDTDAAGKIITNLYQTLNRVDVSNFFVILITTDGQFIPDACAWAQTNVSRDPVPITVIATDQAVMAKTITPRLQSDYNSVVPTKIALSELTDREQYLLTKSQTFCMYPWIHLHAYPTGQAYPCCHSEMDYPIGNCREKTLKEIWNDQPIKKIRQQMLNDQPIDACVRCYEQERSGFHSGRLSANKHHGHHVKRVAKTQADGQLDQFQMTYWDLRFSNLCNLSCRSCGHIFSSNWYQDQVALAGPEWAKNNRVLNYAGRYKTDMWEQLIAHIDYVEQIYFAGGEPLMMEEHYNILEELERRGRFDVRLIYNTNFTHVKLKDRYVFDYWRKFNSVAVGASLDAMGPRAEYIRRGTNWATVEDNRRRMQDTCPDVDFYISPTLSILNAWHLPDFHQNWVDQGLIRAQDLNVNILQDPAHYRIDIAPDLYKEKLTKRYQEHINWLRPLDGLNRATVGFESAINFMRATDNTGLIPKFWNKTFELDRIRNESVLEVIPELAELS